MKIWPLMLFLAACGKVESSPPDATVIDGETFNGTLCAQNGEIDAAHLDDPYQYVQLCPPGTTCTLVYGSPLNGHYCDGGDKPVPPRCVRPCEIDDWCFHCEAGTSKD